MLWKLVVVGIGFTLGDVLMKTWVLSGSSFKNVSLFIYLLALVVYGTSYTTYAYQLFTMNFSVATITPILVNIISVALISFFYYKESLSIYQCVGIILAFIAIVLFSK